MPFFQNPFSDEFRANWLLGDRQHIPTFVVPGNSGRGKEIVYSWNSGPFDLSGNDADGDSKDTLVINYCLHNPKNWATLEIDLTAEAASSSAVTHEEIVASLRADVLFKERFNAEYDGARKRVVITSKKPITEFQFYVVNGRADTVVGFNKRAGVAQVPSYFSRHTIDNRFNFSDSEGRIIELDPSGSDVDAAIIDNAVDARGVSLGFDSGTVKEDWQLLGGKSGIFNFQKLTVDDEDRITQIIEYPAGATAGDVGRKILYTYTDTNKNPDTIAELPYTLQTGDLITP
jgi:hypothetical protein